MKFFLTTKELIAGLFSREARKKRRVRVALQAELDAAVAQATEEYHRNRAILAQNPKDDAKRAEFNNGYKLRVGNMARIIRIGRESGVTLDCVEMYRFIAL
jgi:hypothetical protein